MVCSEVMWSEVKEGEAKPIDMLDQLDKLNIVDLSTLNMITLGELQMGFKLTKLEHLRHVRQVMRHCWNSDDGHNDPWKVVDGLTKLQFSDMLDKLGTVEIPRRARLLVESRERTS